MSVTTTISPSPSEDRRVCAVQAGILVVCSLLLVRNDLGGMVTDALRNFDATHLLVAPILIGLLWWMRRRDLPTISGRGSWLGPAVLLVGVAIFIICNFPFNYMQPRRLALPVLVCGAVLTTAGWRGLRFWFPMLLLTALAIPIGARFFVALIVRPETVTIDVVYNLLDLIPGVTVTLDGLDMTYRTDSATGSIALGQPNRGVQHLLAMASMIVFAHFHRVRPTVHLVALLVFGLPILLIANAVRLFVAAVYTILLESPPLDGTPMVVGAVSGIVFAAIATMTVNGIVQVLFATTTPSAEPEDAE